MIRHEENILFLLNYVLINCLFQPKKTSNTIKLLSNTFVLQNLSCFIVVLGFIVQISHNAEHCLICDFIQTEINHL
jgi:hypothetical protein